MASRRVNAARSLRKSFALLWRFAPQGDRRARAPGLAHPLGRSVASLLLLNLIQRLQKTRKAFRLGNPVRAPPAVALRKARRRSCSAARLLERFRRQRGPTALDTSRYRNEAIHSGNRSSECSHPKLESASGSSSAPRRSWGRPRNSPREPARRLHTPPVEDSCRLSLGPYCKPPSPHYVNCGV